MHYGNALSSLLQEYGSFVGSGCEDSGIIIVFVGGIVLMVIIVVAVVLLLMVVME